MASRDLTSLQPVKDYLGLSDANSDRLLTRLITAMSAAFVDEVGFEILRTSYNETLDGNDERLRLRAVPRVWLSPGFGFAINLRGPVIGDPALTIDGDVIPKRATLDDSGWVLIDGYRLELVNVQFSDRVGNINIVYEGGQYIPAEAVTVPGSPYQVQASQAQGSFLSNVKVSYASSGNALTKVASAPAVGQYTVNATGAYTFAAADTGVAVYLSYAYLPSDVEQCVIEMVAYTFRKRERLDHVSGSLGGQSVFFSRDPWPITVQQTIDRWRHPPV